MKKAYISEFKAKVVIELLREEKSLSQLAGEKDIHPNLLGKWKKDAITKLHTIFEDGKRKKRAVQEEIIQELYTQIGELSTKLNLPKKNLELTYERKERIKLLNLEDKRA